MSNEHKKHSLGAVSTGPWKVFRRGPKTYTIDWKGKTYTVSIDCLQPTYTLLNFDQSCHDVSRSASPNNHTRLSAAQMSHISLLSLLPFDSAFCSTTQHLAYGLALALSAFQPQSRFHRAFSRSTALHGTSNELFQSRFG